MTVDIKSLQNKILEIALYFDKFCQENNITYYLMGGSALGAIRHKGFIPWDDDLDVFMTFDNYTKFLSKAKQNLNTNKFYLQEENTEEWPMFFTKLRLNGTTFIEENTMDNKMHQGVYIDVMCLNNVSSNIFFRFIQYSAALLLTSQTIMQRGYKTNSNLKKKVAMLFSHFFVRGYVKKGLLAIVRSLNKQQTSMVGHFFGRAPFLKTSFPREWLGSQRYVPFELSKLPIPTQAEKYLTLRFGDFMKMPNESTKSEYPVHAHLVDLSQDYSVYIK